MAFDASLVINDVRDDGLVPAGKEDHWREFLAAVAEEIACDEGSTPIDGPRYVPRYAQAGQQKPKPEERCRALRERSEELAWFLWSQISNADRSEYVADRAQHFIIRMYRFADPTVQRAMEERLDLVDPAIKAAVFAAIRNP